MTAGSPLFYSHKYQRALLFEKHGNRDYVKYSTMITIRRNSIGGIQGLKGFGYSLCLGYKVSKHML